MNRQRSVPPSPPMPVAERCAPTSAEAFKRAARRHAAPVTVVTTRNGGSVDGVTVSAFTTLSVQPLLVLVAIGSHSRFLDYLRSSGVFAVNLLGIHQQDVARYFSDVSRVRGVPDFPFARSFPGPTGAPILDGSLGFFDCVVEDTRAYGDHHIVVGGVRGVSDSTGLPLLYYNGNYRTLSLVGFIGGDDNPSRSF